MAPAKPTDWIGAAALVAAAASYVAWMREQTHALAAQRFLFEESRRLMVEASLAQRLEGP